MNESTLRLGLFTPSVLLQVAKESGELRRAGLVVEESLVTSSPEQFLSLDAGDLDVVFTSPDNVLAYSFLTNNPLGKHLSLEITCALDRGLGLSLNVSPGVLNASQLRHQVVGVDVANSGFAFVLYALLDREGLSPGDYHVEALGSTPRRVRALVEGGCAATILNAGNELRAQSEGCRVLSYVSELGPYLGTVVAALTSDDEKVNAARTRFSEALRRTIRAIVRGERGNDVTRSATSLLGLTTDQARAYYDRLLDPEHGLVPDGLVERASVATLVDLRRRFLPTPELDTIEGSLDALVVAGALK